MKKQFCIGMFLVLALTALAFGAATPSVIALTSTGSLTAVYSAACAATTCVVVPLHSLVGAEAWQITGTFTATVTFEGTVDGATWVAVAVVPVGGTRTLATTATAPGLWQMNTAGLVSVRARCSAFTSGTIVVTGRRAVGPPPQQ